MLPHHIVERLLRDVVMSSSSPDEELAPAKSDSPESPENTTEKVPQKQGMEILCTATPGVTFISYITAVKLLMLLLLFGGLCGVEQKIRKLTAEPPKVLRVPRQKNWKPMMLITWHVPIDGREVRKVSCNSFIFHVLSDDM